MQKVRAEIHLKNIKSNAEAFKTLCKTRLCAVVKADAYGHGAEETVGALESVADCFAVSVLGEAIKLRGAACGKDILILTPPTAIGQVYAAAKDGFILTVADTRSARLVLAAREKYRVLVRVHLKVNTGMNRYGMSAAALGKVCKALQGKPQISVEGLYSHLYGNTRESAESQRQSFERMRGICRRYFPSVLSHLSATRGALLGKDYAYDMVRIGIGLYGYLPDGVEANLSLKKAMTVYAQVTATGFYQGGGAGYGEKKVSLKKGDRLYICRYGYADGFLRKRKNGARGWRQGANNLCMDACVRRGRAKLGAWVKIMDDADETARAAGTISYEVLCAATRRAETVYDYE